MKSNSFESDFSMYNILADAREAAQAAIEETAKRYPDDRDTCGFALDDAIDEIEGG